MDDTINPGATANPRDTGVHEPDLRLDRGTSARSRHAPDSIASLFSQLWRNTTELVSQQAELAKAEASEKVTQLALGAGAIAAGGAVVFAGFIILLMSAVNALAPHLPAQHAAWLAPLIVGVVIIVVGFIMFGAGKKALEAHNLKPSRSVEAMRRNTEMVKEHVQ
ncbi:MAG: phage holin family protein [Candidatus Methylophosphatis roskildensis]